MAECSQYSGPSNNAGWCYIGFCDANGHPYVRPCAKDDVENPTMVEINGTIKKPIIRRRSMTFSDITGQTETAPEDENSVMMVRRAVIAVLGCVGWKYFLKK